MHRTAGRYQGSYEAIQVKRQHLWEDTQPYQAIGKTAVVVQEGAAATPH